MFCFYLYQYIEEKKQQKEDKEMERCLDERSTAKLLTSTLRKIGCEPKTEVKGKCNWIYFTYQGEKYTIECNDESFYINLYDTWWHGISIYSDLALYNE